MEKDVGWKVFFEDNHRYADIINGVGCHGRQLVKDTDLQVADPTEKKKSRDLLRRVAFGMNFVIIGIENQETVDYKFPLRNMQYDVSRYQKQASVIAKEIRKNSKNYTAAEYLSRFSKDSKLNPLVTIILYAGEDEWDGPNSLYDMLDFSNVPEDLKNMVSDYKINVIDIRRLENTSVFKTDVRYVFDFIRYAENKDKLLSLVENNPYYSRMENDALEIVTAYTNIKDLVQKEEYQAEGGKTDVCKAIRDLMDDSRAEGREEGRQEGRATGMELMKLENAKNLLDLLSDEIISERIQLPLATVQGLRAEQANM